MADFCSTIKDIRVFCKGPHAIELTREIHKTGKPAVKQVSFLEFDGDKLINAEVYECKIP